jgi:hypothetical protein
METVVVQLEALGAHRTRRHSSSASGARVAVSGRLAGGLSGERPRNRPPGQTLQQAVGQTLSTVSSRRFALAIGVAAVLVAISGAALFLDGPLSGRSDPPAVAASPAEVRWFLDSNPPGASIVEADSGRELGKTPWQRRETSHSGSLRVHLQLSGHRPSTIVLKYDEPTNQKVSLDAIAPPVEPPAVVPPSSAPAADGPPPAPGKNDSSPGAASAAWPRPIVHWIVSTKPRGADVIRAEDGKPLGKSPFKLDQESRSGVLKLLLRLDGYQESSVILDLSAGSKQTITLQKRPGQGKKPAVSDQIPTK